MKSVLYIEDEANYAEVVKRLHEMVGEKFHGQVEFRVMPSWETGANSVLHNPPSVVLLDLSLPPGTDTNETLASFAQVADQWPPTMILTGNKYDLELRRRCFLLGADDFFLKEEANRNPEQLCERIYHCYLRRLFQTQHARA